MSTLESLFRLGKSKNWIEKTKVEDLEKERLRIDNQIQLISREIEKLEKEKKELFKNGVGKTEIEKMLLAEKIKDRDSEIKMKIRDYNKLMNLRRSLGNLIMLKNWEYKLKEKGIWDKIKSMNPEELIKILSGIQFMESEFEKNIDKIKPEDCHNFVKENYSLERYAQNFLKLYEELKK